MEARRTQRAAMGCGASVFGLVRTQKYERNLPYERSLPAPAPDERGLITPPMGLCLFVADSVSGVGMGPIIRRILPMLGVQFLILLLITFVPALVTFLPRLAGY